MGHGARGGDGDENLKSGDDGNDDDGGEEQAETNNDAALPT